MELVVKNEIQTNPNRPKDVAASMNCLIGFIGSKFEKGVTTIVISFNPKSAKLSDLRFTRQVMAMPSYSHGFPLIQCACVPNKNHVIGGPRRDRTGDKRIKSPSL